jgi:hypothetical protein
VNAHPVCSCPYFVIIFSDFVRSPPAGDISSVCVELHAPSEQAQKNLGGCAPEPAPEKVRAFGAHKRGFAAHNMH